MDKAIDGHLVLAYRSGDQMALTKLVKRWHKLFCNKAHWLVNDADLAKDIAQESWTIIIHKIHDLNDVHSFGSWALRIVYSKSLDALRKRARKQIKQDVYAKELETQFTEDEDDISQLKIRLLQCIKTLPENQQVVIRLFYVEEYTLKDISKMLNIRIGTAKSRLFHAREKLRKSLKK